MGSPAGKRGGLGAEDCISDYELAHRKLKESASRRFQAAEWLRQMDRGALESLPEHPSEEEFCLALRNGLILCNVLNAVNTGAISKVVENPVITIQSTDGAAHSAIQYFENMRNFLVAVGEMKLLTFEASDLEKGGSSVKVVDCILCLKGYHEWKLAGGNGVWRYGGIVKITSSIKGWPSPSLSDGSTNESDDSLLFLHNNQLLEFLHFLAEASLEESKAANALSSLFEQFGLRLMQSFLTEWPGAENLHIDTMLIDMVLEQSVKELYMLLVSQKNKLGFRLKKQMEDHHTVKSNLEFVEAVLGCLEETRCNLASCLKLCHCGVGANLNPEKRLDVQQKQLEKLKFSFHKMEVQVQHDKTKWEEDLTKLERHVQHLELNSYSYNKLLEENRLLHNQIQDLKGNIRVYCRVRPFLTEQPDGKSIVDHIGENGSIMILSPQKEGKDARKIFSFNKVFGAQATQSEVFSDTRPLIRSVMDGYNVCIFAYGQTGSGKTYTMSGPDASTEDAWGVNYRALSDLFDISKLREGTVTYDVCIQMIEIYNERVRDLLVAPGSNRRLEIRNNSQLNGINVPDASLVSVRCTQDVLDLMKIGQGNRAVGATALNERSSRSHSVLTVHVQGKELASGSVLRSCLHLVDLAGSERVDKSEATGERLKEAQHINKSLSALGDVISALAQKSSHIPYRNSKLTQVLQDALGGQAKTLMFVHINPEIDAFGETVSTLKFAERVSCIELGAAHVNKEAGEVRGLKEEICKLKSAMEIKESELVQLRDDSRRKALELQNLRAASPLDLQKYQISMNLKAEGSPQPPCDARRIECKSCSSGKRRKPRFPSVLSEKDVASKSPLSAGETYINSQKMRSPSPPVIRSLPTDRTILIKSKSKIQNVKEMPILKLRIHEKHQQQSLYPQNRSIDIARTLPIDDTLRSVATNNDQFKTALAIRKNEAEIKTKSSSNSGGKAEDHRNNDFSEAENECSLAESPLNCSFRGKRFQSQVTRISQPMEQRGFFRAVEPLYSQKHENRPPNGAVRDLRDGSKTVLPEIRRSRSLPRGRLS